MKREHHVPLFHHRLVKARIKTLDQDLYHQHEKTIAGWLGLLQRGDLAQISEVKLHGAFLQDVLGGILGYVTAAHSKDGRFELDAERKIGGGSADGAIGFFTSRSGQVVAPIELKGASQYLDIAKGRSLTPVQQGWDYANKAPESRWIIISNYRETRLYAKSCGQAAYELFRLEELATEDGFLRFVALLGRDAILGGLSPDKSPLAEMLIASQRTEREITERLYAKYRDLRVRLFEELCRRHSNIPAEALLEYAQTILDRVLFLAFAEDRQLIPPSTLARAYEHRDPYHPRPVWHNFLAVFHSIDQGNPALDIPLYNGGLFREVAELADLEISDETCRAFKDLGEYDFADDVSVDVLGHVFEQSIADLEQLRREAISGAASASTPPLPTTGTQKTPSKRKKEGIYYTPPFITSYLVRETLGHTIADAWERSGADRATNKRERIEAWERYRSQLRLIRVLDPACGSGAFLIAVFDTLAQEFARVNRALAELRGEVGQTTFFDLSRTVLNENLFGVDKSAESVEITKLSLWLKTAERGKKLTFLERNIRHGNSVVTDPTVDSWAFDWNAGQVARSFLEPELPDGEDANAIAARWKDGFDVVIGNPPYVRQELLIPYKDHWRTESQVFDGAADLFIYFFERGIQQLKTGGRLGFIVSNKWLKAGYAEKLRELFANKCTIETIVDFGHAPIFPDADAFPCIITLRKLLPKKNHSMLITQYPREELGKELLASYIESHHFELPQNQLKRQGWSIDPPEVQAVLEKLRQNGTPLGNSGKLKPYYGVKTGCNEAFLIDQTTKERLCREDPRSAELLKKYLRGQDIARWSPKWAGLWMIFARRGVDIESYPAVMAHLEKHRSSLTPRPRDYRGNDWPGRKPGTYKWYEIQDAVDYFELFEGPMLLFPDILWRADFCVAPAGTYSNNTIYLLPTDDKWLLACLNSPAIWYYLWRTAQHGKDEALRMFGEYVVTIPIASPNQEQLEATMRGVEQLIVLTRETQSTIASVLDLLRVEYEVGTPGPALTDFPLLNSDEFVREVKKRRQKDGPSLTPASLKALRGVFDTEVPGILQKRAQMLSHERVIAAAVHSAYQLNSENLTMMHKTAPPRMPPSW